MRRRHSLIVGGTRGVGRAVAAALAREGDALSVLARRLPPDGERVAADAHYLSADLLDAEAIRRAVPEAVARHGKLNCLVFVQRYRGDGDAWAGELAISLTATKAVIECAAGLFAADAPGAIVVVGSAATRFVTGAQPVGYHVAKAGLMQMMRYYAAALGPRNVRVNAVSPTTVLKRESRDFYLKNETLCSYYKSAIPLGRMGTAEEMAEVVAFLCGPKASFITGQEIVVDGGMSLLLHDAPTPRPPVMP